MYDLKLILNIGSKFNYLRDLIVLDKVPPCSFQRFSQDSRKTEDHQNDTWVETFHAEFSTSGIMQFFVSVASNTKKQH